MRPISFFLLLAPIATCVPSAASAQRLQSVGTSTHIVVDVGGHFTWAASEILWSGAPPEQPSQAHVGGSPATAPGVSKPATTSVEIIAPTQSSDASLAQWVRGASTKPQDVSIRVLTATGAPVTTYLLHRAVPTKLVMNQLDEGKSQIAMTRITFTAQSVTMSPNGE